MRLPRNPYVAGRRVEGPDFVGRLRDIGRICDAMEASRGASVVIEGPRRIGKSSVLYALQAYLSPDRFTPLYVDLLPHARLPLQKLLLTLAEKLAEHIGLPSPPVDSFDTRGMYFRREFLPTVYQKIGPGRRLVLLLDELDVLGDGAEWAEDSESSELDLFGYLSQVVDWPRPFSWIGVVGGDPRERSPSLRGLMRSAEEIVHLWLLDPADADELIGRAERLGVLNFEPDARERLGRLASRHPWALQLLCRSIYAAAVTAAPSPPIVVSAEDVDRAVPEALRDGNDNFEWWWNGLSPGEKVYCATLAHAGPLDCGLLSTEVDRSARAVAPRLGGASVLPDPARMVDRRLLERGEADHYRFPVQIFGHWVKKSWTVREAADSLDRRRPAADDQYRQARAAFERGHLALAIEASRRALDDFPAHFGARLLLGEAQLAYGQPDLAIEALATAFEADPDAGRGPYVRALASRVHALLEERDPGVIHQAQLLARELYELARRVDESAPEVCVLNPMIPPIDTEAAHQRPGMVSEPWPPDDGAEGRVEALRARIAPLFTGDSPPCGRYLEVLDRGEEWARGLLYYFQLETVEHLPVSLQVFENLANFGGELWERAAHSLLQLSVRRHVGIPRVLDGGFHAESHDHAGFGYIVTDAADDTLLSERTMQNIRSDREQGLLHFFRLADALSILHEYGIAHRNLWPGAIERKSDPTERDGQDVLRLARFEMSILIANLLRQIDPQGQRPDAVGTSDRKDAARRYYLDQGPHCLLCCPPERLARLFGPELGWGGSEVGSLEDLLSDVYGLGMVVAQWFVEDLDISELGRVLVSDTPVWSAFKDAHQRVLASIARANLPEIMKDLLSGMIAVDMRSRPTSDEVRTKIQENYNALLDAWRPHRTGMPHLIGVIAEQTVRELHFKGGLSASEGSDYVQLELCERMSDDLRGGMLAYSDRGFSPYVRSPNTGTDEARYVFLGKQWAWFAVVYEHRGSGRLRGVLLPQVMLVKYVLERHLFRPMQGSVFKALPEVEVFPYGSVRLQPDRVQDRPLWSSLIEAVALRGNIHPWHQQVIDALGWLIRYQRVQLDARLYPFVRMPGNARGESFVLQFDRNRDRDYVNQDPLLALYCRDERRRPPFFDFFDSDISEDASGLFVVLPDRAGRPDQSIRSQLEVAYRGRMGGDAIRVHLDRASRCADFPERGWLQPRGDFASALQIRNQERALLDALSMGGLLDSLKDPRTLRRNWAIPELPMDDLRGDAPEIVKAMITAKPFYALHGPPGTGKTTVAVRAIEGMLRADRGARILVAAQSHYALDHLAEKLLERTDRLRGEGLKGVTAVRVASPEGRDKVSEKMRQYFSSASGERAVKEVLDRAQRRLAEARDRPEVLDVIRRWRDQAPKSQIEVEQRLERGANLVFVTCGAATTERLGLGDKGEGFDRVLVEEAAKAWPTELLMPLVRGREWMLIGDHLQLPAYKRDEVIQLLRECAESNDERLRQAGLGTDRYIEVFDVFKNLFERTRATPTGEMARLLQSPVGALKLQFRMREPIGELVSRAFYRGGLATDPTAGGAVAGRRRRSQRAYTVPPWMADHELIWLDMGDLGKEEPCWQNAVEADVVARIAASVHIEAQGKEARAAQLAVLAPYRNQVSCIQRNLKASAQSALAEQVHTVDSFQGREAEIVIVSLVRINRHDPVHKTRLRLGHMAAPERLNVMVSRARQRLVLVGSFRFYLESKVEHWDRICEVVDELGVVKPIQQALPDLGTLAPRQR